MRGVVTTFYSYKGGVGRSFALANIAALLGRWGFRVLCIDWDLEAPGLEDFFRPYDNDYSLEHSPGLVELLLEFRRLKQVPLQWREYVCQLDPEKLPGVSVIKAGRSDLGYIGRLQRLKWDSLYRQGLGNGLEVMFDELRQEYDHVLIDARTGVTDFSGIIMSQLPDILAFLFTANEQSFRGATSVSRRAAIVRNDLAVDRSQLLLLPIPARFEMQLEHKVSSDWRRRFVSELTEFYSGWASIDVPIEKLVQATTIPYVPFWSFGERISIVEDPTSDPSSINFCIENIAGLLAHKLGQTRLLSDSRDDYVASAKRLTRNQDEYAIFLSYPSNLSRTAESLKQSFERKGMTTKIFNELSTEVPFEVQIKEALERARHCVVLLDERSGSSRWLDFEIRTFLRQAASDETARRLIPFVVSDFDRDRLPSMLQQYQIHTLDSDTEAAAQTVWNLIYPTAGPASIDPYLVVKVTSDGGTPIENVYVCALSENGTSIDSLTDENGTAEIRLLPGRSYKLLCAHHNFTSKIISDFSPSKEVKIRLEKRKSTGSAIFHSVGEIPGLLGRLNPILDTSGRTYLYADNIAINGGETQPAIFSLEDPLFLEDRIGTVFSVSIKLIEGRVTLLEYRRVTSELNELIRLRITAQAVLRQVAGQGAKRDGKKGQLTQRELIASLMEEFPDFRLSDESRLIDFFRVANAAAHGADLTAKEIQGGVRTGRWLITLFPDADDHMR